MIPSNILPELQEALGVLNLCEVEERKYALSIRVGEGAVSFLFDMSDIKEIEVYDPEHLLRRKDDVYYVSLLEALSLILKHNAE